MDNIERIRAIEKSPISFEGLRRLNIIAGSLHFIQGIIMVVLGFLLTWERDIYTFSLKFKIISLNPPSFQVLPEPQVVFTIGYLGVILASFLLISAVAHFVIGFLKTRDYEKYLKKGMNPYRWYEYALSSSIMIVILATFVGVWELWSLVMIFVLNASMIMFGYLMEKLNQYTEKIDWSPYICGCIAGFTPWIVIAAYFIAALGSTETNPPAFVYLALLIYFIMFNTFSVNMLLQYKGIGKWKDYLYGEKVYIILSLTAKTILAWLVFIGIFAPF